MCGVLVVKLYGYLLFHNRSTGDLPLEWISRKKDSIRTLAPEFSMRRMMKYYAKDLYFELIEKNSA